MTLTGAPLTLYENVADRVAGLIRSGTLRAGERIPSVRKLSRQLKVSISTVLEAYRLLENRGLIEARPQSGYYVRARQVVPVSEPGLTRPPRSPSRVSVFSQVRALLQATSDPDIIPLGGAVPGPHCTPTRQLSRISGAIARRSSRGYGTYDLPPGFAPLRAQIARRYLDAGCALSPDSILTTCGCQEALALCLRAVAKPGEIIAIESPTYYGHLQMIEVLGLRAMEIPTSAQDGVSLDALRYALEDKKVAACLFVTNHQNPLGFAMPDGKKRELVSLLAEFDVPLIEDDINGDLGFAPERPTVCKAHDRNGSVLLCSSFSKTLAPGARVGWAVPGRYYEEVERMKIATTMATPSLSQMAIAEFLATGGYDHHLRRVRKLYADQVHQVCSAVRKSFPVGTRVTHPVGGHVLWVEMPSGVDSLDLQAKALEHRIAIAPGPIFSAKQKYRNFIRLNCSHQWTDEMERAILTLGRLAHA